MKTLCRIASVAGVVAAVILATSASAQVTNPVQFLPPGGSSYVNPPSTPLTFTDGPILTGMGISNIVLTDLRHTPGTLTGSGATNGDYFDTFNSTLTGTATINLTNGFSINGQLSGSGSTLVTVGGGYTNGAVGGPWNTALTLNWPDVQISWDATSLTLALACENAPGSTSITLISPPGDTNTLYAIDSYFDVQPSITFDSLNWVTADATVPMDVTTAVPEPSSSALLALGLLCLARKCSKLQS